MNFNFNLLLAMLPQPFEANIYRSKRTLIINVFKGIFPITTLICVCIKFSWGSKMKIELYFLIPVYHLSKIVLFNQIPGWGKSEPLAPAAKKHFYFSSKR